MYAMRFHVCLRQDEIRKISLSLVFKKTWSDRFVYLGGFEEKSLKNLPVKSTQIIHRLEPFKFHELIGPSVRQQRRGWTTEPNKLSRLKSEIRNIAGIAKFCHPAQILYLIS